MEKRHPGSGRVILIALLLPLFLSLSTAALPAAPGDDSAKDSIKKMGRAIEKAGKEVGESAAQAGKVVGKESQKIWYRGVQMSKPTLEKAKEEARRAIRKMLAAMDRSIESLKQELGRLEEREAGKNRDGSDDDDE